VTAPRRVLVAIDQFDDRHEALAFTRELACTTGAAVRVVHVIEHHPTRLGQASALETRAEAEALVDEAVYSLLAPGVDVSCRVRAAKLQHVGATIVDEASSWEAEAIVLGSRRLRGWQRVLGQGVRQVVMRLTELPVIVAPARRSLAGERSASTRS